MWTEEKIKTLEELYPETDNETLSELLGIKRGALIKKANNLGFKKTKSYISNMRKKNNPKTYWSDDEIKTLVNHYATHSNNELSVILNKTKKNISRRLGILGLKRTKAEKDFITSKICKLNGRDLNFKFVKKIANKYRTKQEFYLKDFSAYNKAVKSKWLISICTHMIDGNFSIPQLLLKDILEFMLKDKCNYNDRTIIKPLEIDCYFPKWKIGWEYDGRYFHKTIDDNKKTLKCSKIGVKLFRVNEFSDNYRDYETNIKSQLIEQLDEIRMITGFNIKEEDILRYKPKIVYPNLLSKDEKEMVNGKKMSELKKFGELFKKIKKYRLFENSEYNIINDLPSYKKFDNFDDYKNYLIDCNYKSFTELCKHEHPHRLMKKWGLPITLIHGMFN
jgi:hypothetical protein